MYYRPRPREAKTQLDLIQCFQVELRKVKNPCSKEKLVRRGTLLEVAMNVDTSSLWALLRVFGIGCHHLSCAIE